MSRRVVRGGVGPGGSAPAVAWSLLYGAAGFTAGDYYASGAGGGETGSATGFKVGVLVSPTSQATSANRVLAGNLDGAAGWSLDGAGFNATYTFNCRNGVGGVASSSSYTITAADVGKWLWLEAYHTGAGNTIGLRVNGVEVGAPVACVGMTPGVAAFCIGSRSGSFPATDTLIAGVVTSRLPTTLKQSAALAADAKALRDIPCGHTQAWSFKRSGGTAPPATLANQAGVDDLTRVGTGLTYVTTSAPVFAY